MTVTPSSDALEEAILAVVVDRQGCKYVELVTVMHEQYSAGPILIFRAVEHMVQTGA